MPRKAVSRYRLSPAAEEDLSDIWRYTAEAWSVAQAETYLRGLDQKLRALCETPEMARERTEIDPPVRLVPYRSHLIVYRIEGDHLAVIRVVHTRQNWQGLLSE